jgi:hypothetical protein
MTPDDARLRREIGTAMTLAAASLEGAVLGCGEASANVSVSRGWVRIEIHAHAGGERRNIWTYHADLPRPGEVLP